MLGEHFSGGEERRQHDCRRVQRCHAVIIIKLGGLDKSAIQYGGG
jgi:hypothetical protein